VDYCDHESDVDNAFFNSLQFGDGLRVTKVGPETTCEYKIDGYHRITDTSYCDYTRSVENKHFDKLTFGRGLQVTDDDAAGDKCDFTINADQRIKDVANGFCDQIPTVTAFKQYSKLNVGTGLNVVQNVEDCEYTINAEDMKIGKTGVPDVAHEPIRHLRIGSGLDLVRNSSCDFTIIASGSGSGGGGGSACKTTLVEGGIGSVTVSKTVKADGCFEYSISGADTPWCATASVAYVTDIVCVGSGLEVQYGRLGFKNGCFTGAWDV
jgi:hypothetical protein